MNFSDWLARQGDRIGPDPAIVFDDRTITYGEMAGWAASMARHLREGYGVKRGDRVAYVGLNNPRILALLFACARLGAIFSPLNTRLAPAEYGFLLEDSDPKVCFADEKFTEMLAEVAPNGCAVALASTLEGASGEGDAAVDLSDDAPLLIVYTSGTTGRPKGAVLSHGALRINILNGVAMYGVTAQDITLTTIPLFHVGGLNLLTLPTLHQGGCVVLEEKFDVARTLERIETRRPSLITLVPAQIQALTGAEGWAACDLSSLRLVNTGSSIVPLPLIQALHDRGVPVSQVYGTTETCPTSLCLDPRDAFERIGSCGKPVLHCDVRIVGADGQPSAVGERGEIVVRGPNVMTGYWRNEAATRDALHDGWFRTGDVGYMDEDGYFWVVDRKKGLIISGGENIYSAEVEGVLQNHAAVKAVAVIGKSHSRWGEVPVAFVELHSSASATADDLIACYDGKLSRIKWPKEIHFVDALPRNGMGKILKSDLAALL